MEVYVALPTGKIISLEAEALNTIIHVKEKLQAKEGIPSDQQLLMVNTGQRCKELTNDCILSDCSPHSCSTQLRLILRLGMLVFIKTPTGKIFSLKVQSSDTMEDIQTMIEDEENVPPDQQRLIFVSEQGDKHLESGHTLHDYNIANESTIHLSIKLSECYHIFVKVFNLIFVSKRLTLKVEAMDTIESVKAKIEEKCAIIPERQSLEFSGKKLKDGHTLADYNIKKGSTICQHDNGESVIKVFVKVPDGSRVVLEIKEFKHTIKNIKEMIEDKEDIPYDYQRLFYGNVQLKDKFTLHHYNVQKGSTLDLLLRKIEEDMMIEVCQPVSSRVISSTAMTIYHTDTVEDVKARVNNMADEEVPPDQQVLMLGAKVLEDGTTMDDYDISGGSSLYLHTPSHLNEKSSAVCQLITKLSKELFDQKKYQTTLKQDIEDQHKQMQQYQLQFKKTVKLQQIKLQDSETLSSDLKLELHIEKEKVKTLQNELATEKASSQLLKQKCDYLENTVISNLLERLNTIERTVERSQNEERLKSLEDTVERLWAISRDEIFLSNKILGTGGWGYVTKATYRGRRVAAKCLHEAIVSPYNEELFAKEMKISARCRHRNLVEFIGAVPDHPAIIVIELMDCTLRTALTNRRATPNHIHPISMDIAQGLLYLHSVKPHPLIHRDVSASNVLLKVAGNGWIAKLSDLGSAQFVNLAKTTAPGCPLYSAPEVQEENSARQQTVKIDVYSFGVLLIEMLTREMPTGSIEALVRSVQSRWPRFVPLITSCTVTDPNQRPSMRQVIDQLDTIIM